MGGPAQENRERGREIQELIGKAKEEKAKKADNREKKKHMQAH